MGNWCPFSKKKCNPDCVFYRKGMRYWEDPNRKPEPFEECAINVVADCLENLVQRNVGQQKATEQVRNHIANLEGLLWRAMAASLEQARDVECLEGDGEIETLDPVRKEAPVTVKVEAKAKAGAE